MAKKTKNTAKEIADLISGFNKSIESFIPALTEEINELITKHSTDESKIENTLDTLLSMYMHGIGEKLFLQLLEYYKTVSEEGAAFYWNEYDKLNVG